MVLRQHAIGCLETYGNPPDLFVMVNYEQDQMKMVHFQASQYNLVYVIQMSIEDLTRVTISYEIYLTRINLI